LEIKAPNKRPTAKANPGRNIRAPLKMLRPGQQQSS
jgi:hypothetical protein